MKEFLKKYGLLLFFFIIIVIGVILYRWYFYYFTYTDNAYVYAPVDNVNSQVSGQVKSVNVYDGESIEKGHLLLTIDDDIYRLAVAIAQAKLIKAKAQGLDAQEKSEQQKMMDLSVISLAEANLALAKLKLKHTQIFAQHAGYVSNLFLQSGDYVKVGQPLFAVINTGPWWVIANFRETILRRIKVGDRVNVHLDMYPNQTFKGRVESISWGMNRREASTNVVNSTLAFLNANEDWVKLAQLFPVRIHLLDIPKNIKLRIGSSANVKVIH